MKKGRVIVIQILVLLALSGFAALLFSGRVVIFEDREVLEDEISEVSTAYFLYGKTYVFVDSEMTVTGGFSKEPSNYIVEITGLSFTKLVVDEKAEAENESYLEYAVSVAQALKENVLTDIEEISVSEEGEITLYAGDITIRLGEDEDTTEKITDLSNFYDKMSGLKGTLDMTELDTSDQGYAFKVAEDTEEEEETSEETSTVN